MGWFVDMRELKGLEIAARRPIVLKDGAWLVPSQSSNGTYRVTLAPDGDRCECTDFGLTRKPCKHVHAARFARERDYGGQTPERDTDAVPKRPTYPQNWPVYNVAQSVEKHRFQELLADLCRGLAEPERAAKPGPKPHLFRDTVFAIAYKVYEGFSSRRFACDLQDVHAKGYVSRPIPGPKVCAFLANPALTPILTALVVRSSWPLKTVETEFAPDSSGFSTSKFVRWYDEKYGVTRSGHDWVKTHLMVGVKTHVITAIRIQGRDAADGPQFVPLLHTTAENFTVQEASADKAYLSVENVEAVAALGGQAFIAPKSNTTGGAGGLFEKMFHYYQFRREDFLKHYHQRSNVETVFSMMKRKFGDSVRSRNDVAMTNEVLCKALCHNLCVLIMSQCELGIEAVFWVDPSAAGTPDVLPLVRPG
ncbi:MAG TPA: transposase [Gemmataceae bacterium]|nr:transposase [Gemmataceae bacterium]